MNATRDRTLKISERLIGMVSARSTQRASGSGDPFRTLCDAQDTCVTPERGREKHSPRSFVCERNNRFEPITICLEHAGAGYCVSMITPSICWKLLTEQNVIPPVAR